VLYVDLVGSRRIWPAHVGRLVDPDGPRRVPSDRLDDQPRPRESWPLSPSILLERAGEVLDVLVGVANEVAVGPGDEVAGGELDCERLRLRTATSKAMMAATVETAVRMATRR
jgi:hypothetical protein